MIRKLLYFALLVVVFCACKSESKDNTNGDEFVIPDSLFEEEPLVVAEDVMENIIQNVSSPIEMAALVKGSGVPFSQNYLSSTYNVDQYQTSFKKALNLGVYGADLGYLNMYNKTGSVISYLSSIKTLSEDLKVGQFFDFTLLKRLATNNTNLDSLMYISVSSFNKMDKYLRDNNRSNISTLIITGAWIEGLYLATQVAKEKRIPDVEERIGEQKIVLSDLLLILKNYKSDPSFAELISSIEKIKAEYENIKITYELGEPESVEKDGILTIVQNETSHVEITEEQVKRIIKTTEEVRNYIINI